MVLIAPDDIVDFAGTAGVDEDIVAENVGVDNPVRSNNAVATDVVELSESNLVARRSGANKSAYPGSNDRFSEYARIRPGVIPLEE